MPNENTITQIRKRSGDITPYSEEKIAGAIAKAFEAVGKEDDGLALKLAEQVTDIVTKKFHVRSIPAVEEIQDIVEEVLITNREIKTAKAYIIYRDQHRQLRELNARIDAGLSGPG